jgi:hypothetical protein
MAHGRISTSFSYQTKPSAIVADRPQYLWAEAEISHTRRSELVGRTQGDGVGPDRDMGEDAIIAPAAEIVGKERRIGLT